jgi:hypothetical protein
MPRCSRPPDRGAELRILPQSGAPSARRPRSAVCTAPEGRLVPDLFGRSGSRPRSGLVSIDPVILDPIILDRVTSSIGLHPRSAYILDWVTLGRIARGVFSVRAGFARYSPTRGSGSARHSPAGFVGTLYHARRARERSLGGVLGCVRRNFARSVPYLSHTCSGSASEPAPALFCVT